MSLSIRGRLFLLVVVVLGALALLIATTWSSYQEARIYSPLYNDQIDDKDILADILPPPAFALEATLIGFQYADAVAERRITLKDELTARSTEFSAAWVKWIKKAEEIGSPTFVQRRTIIRDGGLSIIKQVNSLIAAIDSGADDAVRKVGTATLVQSYDQHKKISMSWCKPPTNGSLSVSCIWSMPNNTPNVI